MLVWGTPPSTSPLLPQGRNSIRQMPVSLIMDRKYFRKRGRMAGKKQGDTGYGASRCVQLRARKRDSGPRRLKMLLLRSDPGLEPSAARRAPTSCPDQVGAPDLDVLPGSYQRDATCIPAFRCQRHDPDSDDARPPTRPTGRSAKG